MGKDADSLLHVVRKYGYARKLFEGGLNIPEWFSILQKRVSIVVYRELSTDQYCESAGPQNCSHHWHQELHAYPLA